MRVLIRHSQVSGGGVKDTYRTLRPSCLECFIVPESIFKEVSG